MPRFHGRPLRAASPPAGVAGRRQCRVALPAGPDALVFDPLEPRVLLNADILAVQLAAMPTDANDHAVIIRMIEETAQVGAQARTVQAVEVVDQQNPNLVLAIGNLAQIGTVAIRGAGLSGAESVLIDADSFGANTLPLVAFTGGRGPNALVVQDHAGAPLTWQINGDGSGGVSGAVRASFTNVASLVAIGGDNTLDGPAMPTTWDVTGLNAGTVAGTTFSGFDHLQGAADNASTFVFSGNGDITNGVAGGAGGYNTVQIDSGSYQQEVLSATNSADGSIVLDGATIAYTGMSPIYLSSGAADVTIDIGGSVELSNNVTLTGSGGTLTVSDPGGAETQSFADPTSQLTITFALSDATNNVTIDSLGNFAAGLEVDNPTGLGSVEVAGSINTDGGNFTVNAATTIVPNTESPGSAFLLDSTGTINTGSTSGPAGAISIAATDITLSAGSVLNADAPTTAYADGAITLIAADTSYRQVPSPLLFVAKQVDLTATGATIEGGDIALQAIAYDASLPNDIPTQINSGNTNAVGIAESLNQIVASIPATGLAQLSPIGLSVIVRGSDANLTLDGATIDSTGTVDVSSSVEADTFVVAIASQSELGAGTTSVDTPFDAAVGFARTTGTVTTSLIDGTSITAADDVNITANGAITAITTAQASDNFTQGSIDPTAQSYAVAITDAELTSTVSISANTVVTAVAGSVNADATGGAEAQALSQTTGPVDATAGFSLGLSYSSSTITSTVNGTITAGGDSGPAAGAFNAGSSSVVNTINDSFNLPTANLQTGRAVLYNAGTVDTGGVITGGTPIGGLVSGDTYYVIVTGPGTFQLAAAPVLALDPSETSAVSLQTLAPTAGFEFELDAVDTSNNSIFLPGHSFTTGDTVVYTTGTDATAIGGLTNGATYTVNVLDAADFQLENAGTVVTLSDPAGSGLGLQFFTGATQIAVAAFASIDGTANTIDLPDNGLPDGQLVHYDAENDGASDPVLGLQSAGTYTVQTLTADTFELIDPAAGTVVAIGDPGTASVQALLYNGNAETFTPAPPTIAFDAINPVTKLIAVNTTGLATGDVVTYGILPGATAIGGLVSGGTYTVGTLGTDSLMLLSGTTEVQVEPGSASGTQYFIDGSNTIYFALGSIDTATGTFTSAANGLSTGETVTYSTGSAALSGLTNGAQYTVKVLSSDAFELIDPATNAVVNPGSYTVGSFDLTPVVVNTLDDSIFLPGNTFTTGEAVVYDVDPAITNSATTTSVAQNGSVTVVPLTLQDHAVGGLVSGASYYVVVVDASHIRLTSSYIAALDAVPITLTSLGSGADQTISPDLVAVNGIGVMATSSSAVEAIASPNVGSTTSPDTAFQGVLNLQPDVTIATFLGNLGPTSALTTGNASSMVTDNAGNTVSTSDPISNNSLSASGALIVDIDRSTAHATVGTDTAASPARLTTPGTIDINGAISSTNEGEATAATSKPKNAGGTAVSLALAVQVMSTDAEATVGSNAVVNAGGPLAVTSSVSYPFLETPTQLIPLYGEFPSEGLYGVLQFFDGNFGLSDELNTWVAAVAQAPVDPKGGLPAQPSPAYSGAVSVAYYNNTSDATIAAGAQVNQDTLLQTPNQAVDVQATTTIDLLQLGGQMKFSLNESPFISGSGLQAPTAVNNFIDAFGRSGSTAIGGALLVTAIIDQTEALIDPNALVHVGDAPDAGLTVTSNETILNIEAAEAGGSVTGSDTTAFAGSGIGNGQNSTTLAGLVADDTGGPTITGGGTITIAATTGGNAIALAGALVSSDGGNSGIGVSLVINAIIRQTDAFIGLNPAAGTVAPTGTVTLDAGAVSLTATTSGGIAAATIAGVLASGNSDAAPATQSAGGGAPTQTAPTAGAAAPANLNAQSGTSSAVGIAGAGVGNGVNDTTLASIDAPGSADITALTQTATDEGLVFGLAGAASLQLDAGQGEASKTIAGAIDVNVVIADTQADLQGLDVTTTDPANAAPGNHAVSLAALQQGTLVSLAVAAAVETSSAMSPGASQSFAGSLAISYITSTTQALVEAAAVIAAGTMSLHATEGADVVVIGGGVSYSDGDLGLGASLAFNLIQANTMAGIVGGAGGRPDVDLAGNLSAVAINTDDITAVAVSAGLTSSEGGTAAAFTLAINIIAPDTSAFTHANADALDATISDATVNADGTVTLMAQDNSNIVSVAGAFAVAADSAAYGAGASWNQIALQIGATIDDATVAGDGGVSLLAESTATDAPLDGKIVAAAVSGAAASGIAVGAAVSVDGVLNTIDAAIEAGSTVTADAGTISITAMDTSIIRTLVGGLAISTGSTGVGAAIGADYVDNLVTAEIDGSTASGQDIAINADEDADIGALTLGLAGAAENALGGSVSIDVISDTVNADVNGASRVNATGTIDVAAVNDARITATAGALAIAFGGVGVGASVTSVVVVNNNNAFIAGDAVVAGIGGVAITANTTQTIANSAIGGAVAADAAITGSLPVTGLADTTQAYVGAPDSSALAGAGVRAGTGSGTTGNVLIAATSVLTLIGTAGALAASSGVGVGIGAAAGGANRKTYAYVGQGATVTADGSVLIEADATEEAVANSIAGSGGSTAGVSLTAGIASMVLTTTATVGNNAVVFARGNVVVSAQDDTTSYQLSGNATGGGDVAVGVAVGISTLNKTTQATIDPGAQVTALALGPAVQTNTAGFTTVAGSDAAQSQQQVTFDAGAVGQGGTIDAPANGLQTGEQVIYGAAGNALGGLDDGSVYYVISVDANHIELAQTAADAQLGIAIPVTQGMAQPGDTQSLNPISGGGVPAVSATSLDTSGISAYTIGPEATAARTGVIVVAASSNVMENSAFAIAGSGGVAVPIGGAVAVDTIDTDADVDAGAAIDPNETGAAAAQDVYVDAARSYRAISVGLGGGVGGTAAIAPGVAVPVLQGDTEALVSGPSSGPPTTVTAAGNIEVAAVATESFVAVAVGVAGAGEAAVGGSVAVVAMDTTTIADISGLAQVRAGGNVLVAATDATSDYAIAGAAGVAIAGAAGAGAFAVTQLDKTTDALIESGAIVDASALGTATIPDIPTGAPAAGGVFPVASVTGVAVAASSSETVTDGAGSGAGGLYAGLAGAVTVEIITANTLAAIRSGAQVSANLPSPGNTQPGVSVTAVDTVNEVAVAGALGAAVGGGVGAGVDVAILRNDTQAVIDAATVTAAGATNVLALTVRNLSSTPIAAGAGVLALGGGIAVLSIGGDFNANYSATDASGNSATSDPLAANGSDVLSQVNSGLGTLLQALTPSGGGGLPPVDPSMAVADNTIDFGTATGLSTGEAVTFAASGYANGDSTGGLNVGEQYFVIVTDPDHIQLATSYDNAVAGTAVPITAATGSWTFTPVTGTALDSQATTEDGPALPDNAVANAEGSTTTDSGTTAAIQNGAVISTASLAVIGSQTYDVEVHAGGFAFGGLAVGVGIAVVTMQADVSSSIGPGVAVLAEPDLGAITVTAARTGVLHVVGIAGSASGLLGLGAAVAAVSDTSNTTALIGASVDDGTITQGSSTTPTTITGPYLGVTVSADAAPTIDLANGAGAFSGGAAGAAAVTSATIGGNVVAEIGDSTTIGALFQPTYQGITVAANRDAVIGPYNAGAPEGIGLAGGLLADAAGVVAETISGNVVAAVGNNASLFSLGAIAITANGTTDAGLVDAGAAAGALAVGEMVGSIVLMGAVQAGVGADSALNGTSVTVAANGTNTANALVYPAGGGVVSGSGGSSSVTLSGTIAAQIGADATLTATAGTVDVTAASDNDVNADDGTTNFGAVAVGGLVSNFVVNDTVQADIGADAVITATTDVAVLATSDDQADTSITGGGGGLVGVEIANSSRSITVDTTTEIDTGATIAAGDSLTVEAQSTITSTVIPQLTAAGLGAGANVTASVTVQSTTTTSVDAQAVLTAAAIEVLADVADINVQLQPLATVDAFVGGSDATGDLNVTSTAQTMIGQDATLIGTLSVDVAALQDQLQASSSAHAQANALGGGQAFAPVTLDATTAVIGAAGALVRTQTFSARANAVGNPTVSSTPIGSAVGVDIYGAGTQSLTYNRSITWNSTVIIVPVDNVVSLTVSPTDAITTQGSISGEISGSTIVVNAVTGDPSAPGSILFDIAPSIADAGGGGTAVIAGTPTLEVASGIGTLDITNQSALTLALNEINLSAPDTSMPDLKVNVTADVQTDWMPVILGIANGSSIDVESAAVASVNVLLGGDIDNPLGQTVINAGSNIVAGGHTIDSAALTLEAGGTAGTAAAPILVTGTTLSATVKTGGLDVLASGTVAVAAISVAGAMVLQAAGIVAVPGTGGILAGATTLTAEDGGIGTTTLPLIVGAPGTLAPLTALAADGIVIEGGTDGLAPQRVQASSGDVLLEASGLAHAQQDITLSGTGALIRSVTGNVTLAAAQSIITGPYTTLQAAGSVDILGTANTLNDLGGTIALAGVIDAPQVAITNFNQPGAVSLTNSSPGTNTTIRLSPASPGNALTTVLLGSDATPTSDTGGVLRYFFGPLTIDGSGQAAVVLLDDSGDLVNQSGTLANGVLTGLGVAAGLTISSVGTLQIALGHNTQTLDVQGVPAGTTVPVLLGGGQDTIDVGTAGHSLANIQGLLTLQGSVAANDTLVIDDSSDTRTTQALLSSNALAGLGMGSANPGTINPAAGIQFNSFGSITVTLGSGDNTLSITGVAAATTVNTAAGDDTVFVYIGQPFAGNPLLVTSTPGSGTQLNVQAEIASDLVLGEQNSTTGLLTDTGGLGIDVAFSGQSLLFIQQAQSLDQLTIDQTVLPTDVISGGADALVTVLANSQSLSIALLGNASAVDILGAGAGVTVIGNAGGERLNVDLPLDPTNVAGTLVDGAGLYAGGGVLEGVLGGTLTFLGLAEFDINFGAGNAAFTLDETIPQTAIVVDGGSGDNAFTVQQFNQAAPLRIDGAEGPTALTLDVPGVPTSGEFANLTLDQVATLVINNAANTTTGVDWMLDNQVELSAAVGNGAPFEVIAVGDTPVLQIIGGLAPSDTLQINASAPSTEVQATLSGDSVALNYDQIANLVSFSGIGTIDLTTGSGPDVIILERAPTSEVTTESINAGNGANDVVIAALAPDTIVNTGTDADSVDIRTTQSGSLTVNTGDGADDIYLDEAGAGASYIVNAGSGADSVFVLATSLAVGASITLHGDAPTTSPGDSLSWFLPNEAGGSFTGNPESGGMLVEPGVAGVAYDGFESSTVYAYSSAPVVVSRFQTNEGQGVTLTATGGGVLAWDLNNDGIFGDAAGSPVVLTWSQLVADGISQPGTYVIAVEESVGVPASLTRAYTTLVVNPVNPTVTATGAATATVGTAYTVDFAATEPGNAVITGWQVNWGDGSAVQDFGANTTGASHIYNVPTSDATVRVSAADTSASPGTYPYAATPLAVDVTLPASFALTQSYTIVEGEGVTLTAPGTLPGTPTSYTWTLDGVADLGSGATLMVTAATLVNDGINDGGTHAIDLVLGYAGGGTVTDTGIDPQTQRPGTALVVLDAPPIATVTPGGTVVVGNSGSFLLTASVASPLQEAHGLTYTADVIDLSSPVGQVGTLSGALTLSATTTISVPASLLKTPGTYEVAGTVSDFEGGTVHFVDDIFVVSGAPTLAVSGSATSVEGQTYDLTIGVSGDDTVSGYLVNWGDGVTQMVSGGDSETAAHVFLQNGSLTVDVTAFDATGTFAASKTVTVANVAPTLALAQPAPAPQGSLSVLAGTITDPGPDDQFSVAINWGDGTGTVDVSLPAGVTSFADGHVYAGASAVGTHTIDAVVTDDNGATGAATTTAVVTSVPVGISALGFAAPLNPEGDTATLLGLTSGTGPLQTVNVSWGDGTSSAGTVMAGTDTFVATHVYANNPAGEPIGSFVATATVTDTFGHTATATADAVVANEPPVVGAITVTSTTVAPGVAVSVSALFSDPGTLDTHTAIINWGDGTQSSGTVTESKGAGTITATHTFDSGTVDLATMTVIDNDGGTAFVTLNAVPSISNLLVSQPTINEGGAITLSGTVSDPMGSASSDAVTITWGDGDTTQATVNPNTDAFSVSHTYLDNPPNQPAGSYSILAAVSNASGESSTAASSVEVNNVAPSVTSLKLNNTDINEGSGVILSGTIVDPGVLDTETVSIAWGDGNTTAATVNRSTRAFTATHTYLDNPPGEPDGSYTIVVTATDNAGAQGTADTAVEVANVAPGVQGLAANAGTVAAASPVTVTGTVVDPGALDSETVAVAWGDGTTSAATVNRTTRVLTATHSYAAAAPGADTSYTITATAMDNSGATGSAQLAIQVDTPAAVQSAVVLAAEPLAAPLAAADAASPTTATADPPAAATTTPAAADPPAASPDAAPLGSVAIAPVQPAQLISLVRSSTITVPAAAATRNLTFDEAADRFVAAQSMAQEMTASLNLPTALMVDDYGEDWMLVGPGESPPEPTTPGMTADSNGNAPATRKG